MQGGKEKSKHMHDGEVQTSLENRDKEEKQMDIRKQRGDRRSNKKPK